MAGGRVGRLLILAIALPATGGCVERRFVVATNVPGAQVYVNNVPIGPSPADTRWEYPGRYEFRVVAQGYEPLREYKRVWPKWYELPGLDFVFEALWPFHIEDVRRFQFELVPATQVRTDELLDAANRLRERATAMPPPEQPDPPANPSRPAPPAVIPVPADTPVPAGPAAPVAPRPPAGTVPPSLSSRS